MGKGRPMRSVRRTLASKMCQLLPQRTSWNSGFFSSPVSRLSHLSIWLVLIPFYLQSYLYPILWNHTKSRITCIFTLLLLIIIIPAVSQWVQHMYSLIRDCPHLVLGYRHKMLLCSHFEYLIYDCVHSYSILPCQMPLWNMSLAARTKQWTAPNLQKLCVHRDLVLTSVPEYKVTQAQAPCLNSSVGT